MTDNSALEARIKALEARVPTRTVGVQPDIANLAECNARALEVAQQIKAEKRDAATIAKAAIDQAFKTQRGKQREQKNLSPVGAELLIAAATAKAVDQQRGAK